ncbi:hypothetical protein ACFQGE_06110 [Halomicroarcula sp. GCM10025817]|uniref:hypothetical protein n=1 Tax=Haloarcula TaxID=2237 RepID=UPI0023E85D96|nr:hypothetical protein [Halomicroarcula sp. SYNS111]
MVDVTLFELHLEGSQFTANAPNSGVGEATESDEDTGEVADEGTGAVPVTLLAVLGVVLALASAVAAKKMLGGDADAD